MFLTMECPIQSENRHQKSSVWALGSCASEWLTLPHAQSALQFLLLAVGGLVGMTPMSLLGSWRGWSAWLEWLWPPQHLQTCLCVVVFTCDITMDKQRMPVHIYFDKQTKFYRWFVGRHLCVLASAAQVAFFWAAYFAF